METSTLAPLRWLLLAAAKVAPRGVRQPSRDLQGGAQPSVRAWPATVKLSPSRHKLELPVPVLSSWMILACVDSRRRALPPLAARCQRQLDPVAKLSRSCCEAVVKLSRRLFFQAREAVAPCLRALPAECNLSPTGCPLGGSQRRCRPLGPHRPFLLLLLLLLLLRLCRHPEP